MSISKHIVRCCIYLTTYDWIKSFLKITIDTEPYMEIYRIRLIRFTSQWKIPFIQITLQTIDKRAVTKRCRRQITEGQWAVLNFV